MNNPKNEKAYRERKKQAGLCTRHGCHELARAERTTCNSCATKEQAYSAKRTARRRAAASQRSTEGGER